MERERLPVVVIGAGPVGLAAAAHLVSRGERPLVLEAGDSVGASMLSWGHVRLFSPWKYGVDAVAARMLEATGWTRPPDGAHPTGRELVERYLLPLAELPALRRHLRLGTRVLAVGRRGLDRTRTAGREREPFVVRIERAGVEEEVLARAVIDASGTYRTPNPLGSGGVPALGEAAAADVIAQGIPDVLGGDRPRFAGRRVLVVGSGHSASGVLLELAALRDQEPGTRIYWAIRRPGLGRVYGGGAADQLPERGRLGQRLRELVEGGGLQVFTGFRTSRVRRTAEGVVLGSDDRELPAVDVVVAATGFRPDLSWQRELRLELDAAIESPALLAPLIDPNVHSCGTVPPHGFEELRHPEPDFYVVGMKSYGRAPTFLLLTGYEQVRSVVAAIAGDLIAARRVDLVLPETGVCSTDLPPETGGGCCAPQPTAACGTGSGAAALRLSPRPDRAATSCC